MEVTVSEELEFEPATAEELNELDISIKNFAMDLGEEYYIDDVAYLMMYDGISLLKRLLEPYRFDELMSRTFNNIDDIPPALFGDGVVINTPTEKITIN